MSNNLLPPLNAGSFGMGMMPSQTPAPQPTLRTKPATAAPATEGSPATPPASIPASTQSPPGSSQPYNYQAAISAGANPNDVMNYLAQKTGYDATGAIKAGANQNDVLKYMSTLSANGQGGETQSPGLFQSVVNSIANSTGLPKLAATVEKGSFLARELFGETLSPAQQKELASNSFDIGSLGAVSAIQNPLDAMGVGAQIGSYLTPMSAEGMAGNWFTKLLKSTAPFAITNVLGQGAQDVGQGKVSPTAQGVQGEGESLLMNYATSVGGMGLLKGMGTVLKMAAGGLMKNGVLQAANKSLVDFASHALSLDGRFGNPDAVAPEDAARMVQSLQKSYGPIHKQAVDAVADGLKSGAPASSWSDVYRGIGSKVSSWYDSLVKAKDTAYAGVFTKDFSPEPSYGAMQDAIDRVTKTGNVVTGSAADSYIRSMQSAMGSATGGKVGGATVRGVRGVRGAATEASPLTMKAFDDLYTSAPPATGATDAERGMQNKYITDLQHSVYQSGRESLMSSEDPRAAGILSKWEQAVSQTKDLRGIASSKLYGDIKNVGDAQAFAENMMNAKPKAYDLKVIQSLDQPTKDSVSNLIFNKALDQSRMNADYTKGGAQLTKMLDNWEPTGLLNPQHVSLLRSFADTMQGSYEDMADRLSYVTTPDMPPESETGAALSKAQNAQTSIERATAIQKGMGNRPLFTQDAKGKYDFSNMASTLQKANTEGRYNSILKVMDDMGSMKNMTSKKIGGLIEAGLGGSMFLHGHPVIGSSVAMSGISKMMGKTGEQLSTEDLGKVTQDLIDRGKLNPQNLEWLFSAILTGKGDQVGQILEKAVGGEITSAGH